MDDDAVPEREEFQTKDSKGEDRGWGGNNVRESDKHVEKKHPLHGSIASQRWPLACSNCWSPVFSSSLGASHFKTFNSSINF